MGSEPVRRCLKLKLYPQPSTLDRPFLLKLADAFLAEDGRDEREYGIVENHDMSPNAWRDAFTMFDLHQAETISPLLNLRAPLDDHPLSVRTIINKLLGGHFQGLWAKKGSAGKGYLHREILACPNCVATTTDGTSDRPPLRWHDDSPERLACPDCGRVYIAHDGVFFLLPDRLLRKLYPWAIEKGFVAGTG